MLPGSRNLSPVTILNTSSNQVSCCCDWLDKICEKFLSTSKNNNEHKNDYCKNDGGQYSSECTLWKDSTTGDRWRYGGGRFFACAGSLFVAADCSSSKVATAPRRNEEKVGCVGKWRGGLCSGTNGSNRICQMDSTTPAARSFLRGDHGDLTYDNGAKRSTLRYQSSNILGLPSSGKTSRPSEDLNSNSPRKVQAGSFRSYETTLSCPTANFLSSSTFRTLNATENSCSRNFQKDFKILDKTSTWCHYEQTQFVSNDKSSPMATKEPINFDKQWLCMSILKQADRNPAVASICSRLARRGYLSMGRGSVALLFKTYKEQTGQFIVPDFRVAFVSYVYLNDSAINSEWSVKYDQSKFARLCRSYDPERQYIFSVTVDAYEEVCCNRLSIEGDGLINQMDDGDDDLVARFCATLPTYILRSLNLSLDIDDPGATLVLTSVPGSGPSENGDRRRAREICFINIQQKLRQRGVSLRHRFPEVYRRLCAYAEKNVEFMPISLFLTDLKTRKKFLCLIMPNSEPLCSWTEEESVGELGPGTIV